MKNQLSRYHHGTLPQTLMQLALEHIEKDGTEKLSLRALAREAGVSPTAPYSHFATKTCLLAAIATQGFRQLEQELQETRDRELPSYDLTIQLGMTYISFALENPTTYKIMFGSVIGDFSAYSDLQHAADSAYAIVTDAFSRLRDEEDIPVDLELLGGSIWAMVHGVASLLIDREDNVNNTSSTKKSLRALGGRTEQALRLMTSGLLRQSSNKP